MPILVLGGLCLIPSLRSVIGIFKEKEKVSGGGTAGGVGGAATTSAQVLTGYIGCHVVSRNVESS